MNTGLSRPLLVAMRQPVIPTLCVVVGGSSGGATSLCHRPSQILQCLAMRRTSLSARCPAPQNSHGEDSVQLSKECYLLLPCAEIDLNLVLFGAVL